MGICNPLSPDAYKFLVRVPLVNPSAPRWILANTGRNPLGTVDFVKTPAQTRGGNGASIHFGTEREGQNPPYGKWHHVSIGVAGEVMTPAADDRLEAVPVQSAGNRSSLLKARITLDMGTARQRDFDFDIGAGVEFDVSCYAVSKLEVLIPDPTFDIPNELLQVPPPGVPQQLATVLTSTIYYTHQGTHVAQPLTYTVPVILSGDPNTAFIPRVADSIEITGGTDETTAAAGGAIIDFIYVPQGLRQVQFVAPPTFFLLDQVILPAASSRFPRVLIPGNANAFRIRRTFGTDDTLINIVQVLNV